MSYYIDHPGVGYWWVYALKKWVHDDDGAQSWNAASCRVMYNRRKVEKAVKNMPSGTTITKIPKEMRGKYTTWTKR